ncbi:hypothetical protein, partial [Asticcacaulis endophyticus]|uniref:hypothetical protein n=1 Tax=Asticcacaulis endophyticus TaxID=1395890 RepID=UPI001E39D218
SLLPFYNEQSVYNSRGTSLAVAVVGTCRTIDGPINLDFMGLSIKGGGGIVVLWIATFLAIVLAIRVLW